MLLTTVANVLSDDDERIVPPADVRYTRKEVRSSREMFERYKHKHGDVLKQWNITEHKRAPNGADAFAGVWVRPYPRDVWDYWINYRFDGKGGRTYHPRAAIDYIPSPDERDYETFVNPPTPGGYVYSTQLMYLWDFIYNPESILSRFASTVTRRREFPTYDNDGVSTDDGYIIPPYLPDATFPRNFAHIYPWAAWEVGVSLKDGQMQGDLFVPLHAVRAQRQTFVRAHGVGSKENDVDAYKFTPHEATEQLGRVVRPFYPMQEASLYKGYFAVPYSPLVLRDLTPFNSNGWVFCFRQAVRYSSDVYFPENKLWNDFKEVNRLLDQSPRMSIDYAVLTVMKKQRRAIWDKLNLDLFDVNTTFSVPSERANTPEAADIQLIKEITLRGRNFQDVYELASTVAGPIMESRPYKVIMMQVYETVPALRYGMSFKATAGWVVTVPPLLSATRPGNVEYASTDATIVWHMGDNRANLSIMFDGNDIASSHQVQIHARERGRSVIEARLTRFLRGLRKLYTATYVFELNWYALNVRVLELNHSMNGTIIDIPELQSDGVYIFRQFADDQIYAYALNTEQIAHYIASTWPELDVDARWSSNTDHARVDFTRPVLMMRDQTQPGVMFVLVVKIERVVVKVQRFGEIATLSAQPDFRVNDVQWTDTDSTSSVRYIVVVSPLQLGEYNAEIRRRGKTGMPDYVVPFIVDIEWNTCVPYRHIVKSAAGNWSNARITGTRPGDVYLHDLRVEYDGEFYIKMIEAWARNHLIDLENYSLYFPYVLEYCRLMDAVVSAFNAESKRVIVVGQVDSNLRQFLPAHIAEPVLNLRLTVELADTDDALAAYVVFDPRESTWVNLLSVDMTAAPVAWLPVVHVEHLYDSIKRLHRHVHLDVQRENVALTQPWRDIGESYQDARVALTKVRDDDAEMRRRTQADLAAEERKIAVDLEQIARETLRDAEFQLVYEASRMYDEEVENMRAYARFVSDVLNTCLRVNIASQSSRVDSRPVVKELLRWKKKQPGTVKLWQQIQRLLDNQRYGVFVCARIANKQKSIYLLEAMRTDNYPRKARYVLYKTIAFVGEHELIDLSDAAVRAAFDAMRADFLAKNEALSVHQVKK